MNEELKLYIKKELSSGVTEEEIRTTLMQQGGWVNDDLNTAFAAMKSESFPVSELPVESQSSSINTESVVEQQVSPSFSRIKVVINNILAFIFIYTGVVALSVTFLIFLFDSKIDIIDIPFLGNLVDKMSTIAGTPKNVTLFFLVYFLVMLVVSIFIFWMLKRKKRLFWGISIIWFAALVSTVGMLRTTGAFHTVAEFLLLISMLSTLFLFIEIIKPNIILRFSNAKYRNRKFSSMIFGGIAIIFFILFGILSDRSDGKLDGQIEKSDISIAIEPSNTLYGLKLSSTLGSNANTEWAFMDASAKSSSGTSIPIKPKAVKTMLRGNLFDAIKLKVSDGGTFSMVYRKVAIPPSTELFTFCFYSPLKGDGDWLTVHFGGQLMYSFSSENAELRIPRGKSEYESLMYGATIISHAYAGKEETIYVTLNGSGPEDAELVLTDFRFLTANDVSSEPHSSRECWTKKVN